MDTEMAKRWMAKKLTEKNAERRKEPSINIQAPGKQQTSNFNPRIALMNANFNGETQEAAEDRRFMLTTLP
jgi:hypothetical protein